MANYGQWCCCFKHLERIRLHWLFHAGFWETRFLKWRDIINSSSWFLELLKESSEGLPLFKLIYIFLIKKDFNKNWCSMCQNLKSRPTHLLAAIWCKFGGRFNMWVIPKTNKPSFCLISQLYHVLGGLFSVLCRLHACKHVCCMLAEWSITERDYFEIFLLGILSSMEPTIYFQIYEDAMTATFQVLVNTYFFNFRLALFCTCLLIVLKTLVHLT